ncbi:hypothetical protein QE152_g3561 [Popillia japonica]|uniref:Uncharacterized protein n=1 Tax=Popillia japonica TaxID=7064 RepID=A0AAW1N464_POPJA
MSSSDSENALSNTPPSIIQLAANTTKTYYQKNQENGMKRYTSNGLAYNKQCKLSLRVSSCAVMIYLFGNQIVGVSRLAESVTFGRAEGKREFEKFATTHEATSSNGNLHKHK